MASVILCSELGRGSRQLSKLADFAIELEAQSYSVRLVCNDLTAAHQISEFFDVAIFQAPLAQAFKLNAVIEVSKPLNYSSILLSNGYRDAATLAPLLRGWLHIIATLSADVIVADNAPTAVLAAKLLNIPCIMAGSGFCVPPLTTPLSSIVPWEEVTTEELKREDEKLLKVVNQVVTELEFSDVRFEAAKDLFSHAAQWIVSIPEMDHYGGRKQAYVVRWADTKIRMSPSWPRAMGDRIFVQMREDSPFLVPLLERLKNFGAPALVVVPQVDSGLIELYHETNIRLQRELVNIRQATDQCKVFINDASHDLVHELLNLGVPSNFLATEPQNKMLAYRLSNKRLGFIGAVSPDQLDLEQLLVTNTQQDQIWHNAAHISIKYESHASMKRLHDLIKTELLA